MNWDDSIDTDLLRLVDEHLEASGSTYPSEIPPSRLWAIAFGEKPLPAEVALLNDPTSLARRNYDLVLETIRKKSAATVDQPSAQGVLQQASDLLQAFIDSGSEALVRLHQRLTPSAFEGLAFGPAPLPLRQATNVRCTCVAPDQKVSWQPSVVLANSSLRFRVHAISAGDQATADGAVSINENGIVTVDGTRYHRDGQWRAYLLCQEADPIAMDMPYEVFALQGTGAAPQDQTDMDRLIEQGYFAAARAKAGENSSWGDERLALSLLALYAAMRETSREIERNLNVVPLELVTALGSFARAVSEEVDPILKHLDKVRKGQGDAS